jgi:hypothetical protein
MDKEETTEENKTSVTPTEESAENVTAPEAEAVDAEIDYRAELEKTRKRLSKAEHKLKEENIKRKSQPELDENSVKEMLEQMVDKRLSEAQMDSARDTFSDALELISSNPDERELIKFHYQNSIVNTGFSKTAIKEDLEKARLLANAARFQKEREELMESAKAKQSMGNTSVGSNQSKAMPTEDLRSVFTEEEWTHMHRSPTWTEELIKKAAEKKKQSLA